jgi:hydrophobe/amphiphile efflux-3 (HAE3) family protein
VKNRHSFIRFRWWILGISGLLVLFFALQIPRAEIDPDVTHYIPAKMTSRVNTERMEDLFGGNDMLILALETDDVLNPKTLQRVKDLSRGIKRIDGITKTMSLFDLKSIKGIDGAMIIDPAITKIPGSEIEKENLRQELKNNKLVFRTVVSEDFTLTAFIMIMEKGVDDKRIFNEINDLLTTYPGNEHIYLGGYPYLKAIVAEEFSRNFRILLPGGLIIMLIMLYLFFRQKRGVFLPFSVVLMAIVISMGIMPLFGWKMSVITLLLPIILIAVANDYGIHMIAKYQELVSSKGDQSDGKELAGKVYESLRLPVIMTGMTTLVGILSLLSHRMIPAKQLGILAAAGIFFALVLSLFLIPTLLSFLKKRSPVIHGDPNRLRWMERQLRRFSHLVVAHPKRILVASLALVLVFGTGLIFLKVDTNVENFFPKSHNIRTGAKLINKKLGGSQTINVLVEGDIKDPDLLKRMDRYQNALERHQGVGDAMAITDVLLEMSKALNDPGDNRYNAIPDTRNAVAQYFELYSMSGDPDDFEQLVDFDYQHAQIIIRLSDGSNNSIKDVIGFIRSITAGDPNITIIGGYGYVTSELADIVVNGQMLSLLFAVLAIIILVMVLFRSITTGLISAIPLVSAILLLFGLMGILGIRLDLVTALLSSMMIGIGIDYTIHFLWRFRKEREIAGDPVEAIVITLQTTGRGILFNALSVIIGFVVLVLSSFPPIRFFGILIVISISACLVGALMIVPAFLLVFKPSIATGKKQMVVFPRLAIQFGQKWAHILKTLKVNPELFKQSH